MVESLSLDTFKSPNDRKQYRVITLPNGLEALLIHSDKYSASGHAADAAESEPEPEGEDHDDGVDYKPRVSRGGYDTESDDDDDDGNEEDADEDDDGQDMHGRKRVSKVEKGTPHAAACLSVGVGSMADPADMRGLAHYLEHMLFMGSAKYPDENEFESFLSTHGGYSNGTTECESTRYLFEIAPQFLRPALDMFAQFFVAPLMKEEAMERELLAIESEFNRARQNDYVRLQQVQCETCASPAAHPYNSFSWGNMDSLKHEPAKNGRDVRAEMVRFYETHYSAHRMKMCVSGEDSLDELEAWVRESFGGIPNREPASAPPAPMCVPFGVAAQPPQEPTLIQIVPVRKMHALHLYWPLPPLLHCYRQKPWEFLSHAMGHEADGSLSAILKDRMWATEVSVGISENDAYEFGSFGSMFEVNVALTKLGLAHWQQVVALVFQVVRFLTDKVQSNTSCSWIFNELRASSKMTFQFQEESYPLSLCRRLAELMQTRHHIDRADLLQYDVLQGEFDVEITQRLLALMTPQNTRVLLLSHSFEEQATAWRRERWLDVQYDAQTIPADTLRLWGEETAEIVPVALSLPEPNPFLSEDFTVLPHMDEDNKLGPDGEPLLVHRTHMSKLWFKRDLKFQTPKTNANFLLCLPSLTRNVHNYICAKIYLRLCHEALQQVQYQSYLANYGYDLSVRDLDIEATFSGFSDKLPALIHAVFDALLHTAVDDSVFTRVRDEVTKEYRNLNLKPAVKARYLRLQLLERTTFPIEDKLHVLSELTADDIRDFKQCSLWQCEASIHAMVHGNITQLQAVALLEAVERAVDDHTREQRLPPLLSPMRPHTTTLPLTANGLLLRDVSDHDGETNSIVEVYYQFGKGSNEDLAYAELLQHVMTEPLFHELRTKQQLGYEVFCMVRETHGVLGFSISVQSASHAAGEIALRVDAFVHDTFLKILEQLPVEELQKHVTSLQRMKTREDATLSEESDRYWEEIQSRRLAFCIDDHVVAELSQCSVAGLLDRYTRWLLTACDVADPEAQVRKLRVHVIGKSSKFVRPLESLVATELAPLLIDNWREYKAALTCHCASPRSKSHSHSQDGDPHQLLQNLSLSEHLRQTKSGSRCRTRSRGRSRSRSRSRSRGLSQSVAAY